MVRDQKHPETATCRGLVVGNYCHDVLTRDGVVVAETLGGAASFISTVHDGLSIQCDYVSKVGSDFAYLAHLNHRPIVSPSSLTTRFHAQFDTDPDVHGHGHEDRVLKRVRACEAILPSDLPELRYDFGMAVGVGGEILPETLERMLDKCKVVFVDIQALIRVFDSVDGTVKLVGLKETGFFHLLPRIKFLKASSEEAPYVDVKEAKKWCCVVVTNGEDGCKVYWEDGELQIAPFSAVQVDPTGAGDSFLGGFVAGLVQGLSVPDSALLGNFFGSLAVGQIGIPKLDSMLLQRVKDEVLRRKIQCIGCFERRDDFKIMKPVGHEQFHESLCAAKLILTHPFQECQMDLHNSPRAVEQGINLQYTGQLKLLVNHVCEPIQSIEDMKHTKKKKKRSRAFKRDEKAVASKEEEDEERKALNALMEAFASVSLEEAVSAHREANGDPNKAAEILGVLLQNAEDPSTSSSRSGSWGLGSSSSEGFMEANAVENAVNGKAFRGSKAKRLIAATGTVSTVLGKDYVMSSPRRGLTKSKGYDNGHVDKEEVEQFLCSMLGDGCELNMAVVRDVLCTCGYDVEKALDALLDLSASSYEQSRNVRFCNYGANDNEVTRFFVEHSSNLTDRASDSTSHSSESELQDNVQSMGYGIRNHSKVLASSEAHMPTGPRSSESDLPQKVLESLFNVSRSSEHEPSTMNWRSVVKKMVSLGQRFDSCPSDINEPEQNNYAKGDEYQVFRKAASQSWDSTRSYYQRAATAYSKGEREYAAYLSEQGKLHTKMAQEADDKASQQIFKARNKSIENVITIDLHGQHVKQAIRLLKLHLLFGTYVSSIQCLRVITGCGSHGVGKSKLKQSVIKLVEEEGIKWSEENRGTVLIKLDGQKEFSFLDCDSETE